MITICQFLVKRSATICSVSFRYDNIRSDRITCGSRVGGGQGGPDPPSPKNHKNIGFLSNMGPDPLKKSQSCKARIQCLAIIGPPAKRILNGVSLAGRW